jgi:protein phosphatase 1 regulatory subunit 7
LKNLHHLYFVQNKISRIEGLDGLSNLTYLELGANRIRVYTTQPLAQKNIYSSSL